MLKKAIWC